MTHTMETFDIDPQKEESSRVMLTYPQEKALDKALVKLYGEGGRADKDSSDLIPLLSKQLGFTVTMSALSRIMKACGIKKKRSWHRKGKASTSKGNIVKLGRQVTEQNHWLTDLATEIDGANALVQAQGRTLGARCDLITEELEALREEVGTSEGVVETNTNLELVHNRVLDNAKLYGDMFEELRMDLGGMDVEMDVIRERITSVESTSSASCTAIKDSLNGSLDAAHNTIIEQKTKLNKQEREHAKLTKRVTNINSRMIAMEQTLNMKLEDAIELTPSLKLSSARVMKKGKEA